MFKWTILFKHECFKWHRKKSIESYSKSHYSDQNTEDSNSKNKRDNLVLKSEQSNSILESQKITATENIDSASDIKNEKNQLNIDERVDSDEKVFSAVEIKTFKDATQSGNAFFKKSIRNSNKNKKKKNSG